MASSNLYGISVIADTQVEPEVTITDAENNLSDGPEKSEESNEEEFKERSISFDVIDSQKTIQSIFTNSRSEFENIFLKNIHTDNKGDLCHINLNGNQNAKNVYVDQNSDISSIINSIDINDGKDKIVVFNHTVIYKVDIGESRNKCTLTAYYKCVVPEDKLSVSVENSENIINYNGDSFYKYNTELMITPQLGWNYTDRGTEPFIIKSTGYLQFILLNGNYDDTVIKINESVPATKSSWTTVWNTYENLHLRKSYFTINLNTDSYVSNCNFLNRKISGFDKYEWSSMNDNSDNLLLTFQIPDDRNVYQVTVNNNPQKIENNCVDLTALLSENMNKENRIDITIKTNPKKYYTVITDEDSRKLCNVIYDIIDGKIRVPYIKTINNKAYRLFSYNYSDGSKSYVNQKEIIDNTQKNINYSEVDYNEKNILSVGYSLISSSETELVNNNIDELVINETIKKRNTKCFATSSGVINCLKSNLENSFFCYDIIEKNTDIIDYNIKRNITNSGFSYIFTPYQEKIKEYISINMLHVDDSELYSDFSEPVNVYYDKHAPNLKVNKIYTPWAGNAVKGVYSFDLTVDDREEAPANASDEIKRIYDEIINAPTENLTEIKSITIGEYRFTNNDGTWEKECLVKEENVENQAEGEQNSEVTLPDYDVRFVRNENSGFTVQIELTADAKKKGVSGLQKEIPVYAEDVCSNVSSNLDGDVKEILGDGQTRGGVPVQIDIDEPKLNQMKVSGVKVFGDLAVKQTDQKLIVQALPYDITSNIDDSQTRMYYEYDSQQVELQRISDAGDYVLDRSDINNTSGYLKLVTTDKCGNKTAFYYCSGAVGVCDDKQTQIDYTLFVDMATPVVIDTDIPEAGLSVTGTTEYKYPKKYDSSKCLTYSQPNEKGGYNTWYNRYPDINVSSEDVNSICSGLDYISLDINNQHIDIPSEKLNSIMLKDGKYYIHFEPKEDKSEFTATLRQENGDITELFDGKLSDDGKLEVVITAHDRAGNVSSPDKTVAYIDNNEPQSEPQFTVKNNPDAKIMRFGTFSNSQLKIVVNVSDKMPSSGLAAAVLNFAGKEYEGHLDLKSGTAEFTVPDKISNNAVKAENIKITVYDNVGNKYVSEPLVSSENNGMVIIENKPPYIWTPVIDGENGCVVNGQKWYSSDVTVTYYVDESVSDESGIAVINEWFTKNGVKQSNSVLNNAFYEKLLSGKSHTEANNENAVFEDQIKLSTLNDKDGEYTFHVEAYDNANNRSEDSVTVYKDVTAPVIKGFSYDNSQKIAPIINCFDSADINKIAGIAFGHFMKNETTLTVIANDVDTGNGQKSASSGIRKIVCVLRDEEGNQVQEISSEDMRFNQATSEYSADFQIPQDFKGTFEAYAVDNVTNKSLTAIAEGMIIENDQKHSQTSSLDIIMPDTQYTDIDGLPLYKEPFTAGISITDTFSGLNESEIRTASNDTNESKKITVDKSGQISGDENESWSTDSKQRNLITHVSRDMFCDNNCNGNSINLSLKDNCSNTSDSAQKLYSIDSTAPVINVMFSGAAADKQYKNIYNGNRTVTIEITERNFDSSLVNIQGISGLSDWSLVSGIRETDSAVYRATAELKEDGKYSFTVNCKDRCENSAAEYRSEEFIIDKSAPVLGVTYDNNSAENGRYYNCSRTATLRINETNFDASRIKITAVDLLSETNIPVISQFKEINGVYQATVSFKNDGQYSFEVTGSDKAGNVMKEFTDSFFIDSKKPDIVISGMKAANKEDVKPVITFTDKYLDTDTVKITLNGAKRGDDLELKGEFSKTESGYVFTAENFPKEKEMDDVYTLVAQAADNANNIAHTDKIFSVNRFGSNFVFDEDTQKIKNKYISKEQPLTVYEIDADKHDEEPMILVIKDAEARELKKDKDYTMECTGGDGDWYKYTYKISEENFSDDAAYAVEFYTHDEAGNNNNSVSDEKDAEFLFGVDKTPPICTAIDFETNGSYKADVKKAHVIIDDNIIVKGIDVFLNGNKTESTVNENNCEFCIPNSKSSQVIKLVVYDMADNTSEYVFENILVSTSIARVLIHKTWFKVAIAATAVTTGAAAAYVTARRKKKMYEIFHGRFE